MYHFTPKVVRVSALSETGAKLSDASGFIGQFNGGIYLISNYHVLAGRDPKTSRALHSSTATPETVTFDLTFESFINSDERGHPRYRLTRQSVSLSCADMIWDDIMKPDVAAIKISQSVLRLAPSRSMPSAFFLGNKLPRPLEVMDDLYIIGYPNTPFLAELGQPIYKRASVASEPEMALTSGFFLADGKTKPGMSGSPVIYREGLSGRPVKGGHYISIGKPHLIGVYSGRDEDDPDLFRAELGIVWSLDETLLPLLER